MRIPRIYIEDPLSPGQTLPLPAPSAQHLVKVLRMKAGAPLILFNGDGCDYEAVLTEVERRRVSVRVGEARRVQRESSLHLHLVQAVSRGERMDYALQKAVELGVTRITPVFSERSVVQLDAQRLARRMAHWRGVVISACEQSGRNVLPELDDALSLSRWLARPAGAGLKLMFHPEADVKLSGAPPESGEVVLLVGPEGGLSDAEQEAAREAGFQAVRLGPRVLRTETATVAALSVLQFAWGDFRN